MMRSETLTTIFFSLRGTLPRYHWQLAMLASAGIYALGLSVLASGRHDAYADVPAEQNWALVWWSIIYILNATLLCAKRLLNCRRPIWLALTLPAPAICLLLAYASQTHTVWSTPTVAAVFLAPMMLPALVACALYDADD